MESWTILTNRIGSDTRNPTEDDIDSAVHDLRINQSDSEHSSICLRRGKDDEEMNVLELFADGTLIYSEYKDVDFEELKREFKGSSLGVLDICRRFFYVLTDDTYAIELAQWESKK